MKILTTILLLITMCLGCGYVSEHDYNRAQLLHFFDRNDELYRKYMSCLNNGQYDSAFYYMGRRAESMDAIDYYYNKTWNEK